MSNTKKIETEYEATFLDIDKEKIRAKLKEVGAILVYSEYLQKRVVFDLPTGHQIKGGWLRVRNEKDKKTMSLKIVDGAGIESQKEISLKIDNVDNAIMFLESIGCIKKSIQENRRELWKFGGIEITIDEWPFLEPFVEIEGKSEEEVKRATQKLGFDYKTAYFGGVDPLYVKKYGISDDKLKNHTPRRVFGGENPYLVH